MNLSLLGLKIMFFVCICFAFAISARAEIAKSTESEVLVTEGDEQRGDLSLLGVKPEYLKPQTALPILIKKKSAVPQIYKPFKMDKQLQSFRLPDTKVALSKESLLNQSIPASKPVNVSVAPLRSIRDTQASLNKQVSAIPNKKDFQPPSQASVPKKKFGFWNR